MITKFKALLISCLATVFRVSKTTLNIFNPFWWLNPHINPHSKFTFPWSNKALLSYKLDIIYQNILGKRLTWARNIWKTDLVKNYRPNTKGKILPVQEFAFKDKDMNRFFKEVVSKQRPCVLRGYLNQFQQQDFWNFDQFIKTYGEEEVLLACPVKDGYRGKLKEVNYPGVYLHNSERLLRKFPQLLKQMGLEKVTAEISSYWFFTGVAQLFAGRKGTGTWWHSAGGINLFLMLDGKKRWTFLDPAYSPGIFPFTEDNGKASYYLSAASIHSENFKNSFSKLNQADQEKYFNQPNELYSQEMQEIFESFDRYQVDLEPGDLLYNPPWWWHDVHNITNQTIAVATRWFDPKNPAVSDTVFDLGNSFNIPLFFKMAFSSFTQKIINKDGTINQKPKDSQTVLEAHSRSVDFNRYTSIDENVQQYYQRIKKEQHNQTFLS